MHPFSLDVNTLDLTRALRHLRRIEHRSESVQLQNDAGVLTLSMGRTSQEVHSTGTWPQPVCVLRAWVETLADTPHDAAITTLRVIEGMLWARDFGVPCQVIQTVQDNELITRLADAQTAFELLQSYGIEKAQVVDLIDRSRATNLGLWGPDDKLINEIAQEWKTLASHGVEPSDIRDLITRKSRDLWRIGKKPGALFDRYNVTEKEREKLIQGGDPKKASFWTEQARFLLDPIAKAWKVLAVYGVQPWDICLLLITAVPNRRRDQTIQAD